MSRAVRSDPVHQFVIAGLAYSGARQDRKVAALNRMIEAAKRLTPGIHEPVGRPSWWRELEGRQREVALIADLRGLSIAQLARTVGAQPRALLRWLQSASTPAETARVEQAISKHLGDE